MSEVCFIFVAILAKTHPNTNGGIYNNVNHGTNYETWQDVTQKTTDDGIGKILAETHEDCKDKRNDIKDNKRTIHP